MCDAPPAGVHSLYICGLRRCSGIVSTEIGPESCRLKSALATESIPLTVPEGLDLPLGTFQLQDEGINVIPMRSKTLQSTESLLHVQGHNGLGAACLRLGRG